MAKTNQKCVRLSDRVTKYIEAYRGDNFSEKLENLVLDMEERREDLVQDWNRLQAQISDKHHEMVAVQERVRMLHQIEPRLDSLVESLLDLMELSCYNSDETTPAWSRERPRGRRKDRDIGD